MLGTRTGNIDRPPEISSKRFRGPWGFGHKKDTDCRDNDERVCWKVENISGKVDRWSDFLVWRRVESGTQRRGLYVD